MSFCYAIFELKDLILCIPEGSYGDGWEKFTSKLLVDPASPPWENASTYVEVNESGRRVGTPVGDRRSFLDAVKGV